MGQYTGKPYRPSNGTEGDIFECKFCAHCFHDKYIHTSDNNDKQCEIYNDMLLYSSNEPEYPKELVYDENDKPVCTKFQHWDWDREDDGTNEPPAPEPISPNQLVFGFILDEIESNIVERKKEMA